MRYACYFIQELFIELLHWTLNVDRDNPFKAYGHKGLCSRAKVMTERNYKL